MLCIGGLVKRSSLWKKMACLLLRIRLQDAQWQEAHDPKKSIVLLC